MHAPLACLLSASLLLAPATATEGQTSAADGDGALLGSSRQGAVALPTYRVRFIGPGTPSAINTVGEVCGDDAGRAWFAGAGGVPEVLPLPAEATSSLANDINDLGWVVGQASGPDFGARAVIWRPLAPGTWSITEVPSPNDAEATAVNDVGDVIGWSVGLGTFYYNDSEGFVELFPFGVTASPADINDERVLVGRNFFGEGESVDLDTLVVSNLGLPTGTGVNYMAVDVNGVNDAGDLCGRGVVATAQPDDDQAVRFSAADGWTALNAPVPQAFAIDLDAAGNTLFSVGFSSPVFVFYPGAGSFDLETRLAPGFQDWDVGLVLGGDISDDGRVICTGGNGITGESGVVVLEPEPVPGKPSRFSDGGRADFGR